MYEQLAALNKSEQPHADKDFLELQSEVCAAIEELIKANSMNGIKFLLAKTSIFAFSLKGKTILVKYQRHELFGEQFIKMHVRVNEEKIFKDESYIDSADNQAEEVSSEEVSANNSSISYSRNPSKGQKPSRSFTKEEEKPPPQDRSEEAKVCSKQT